MMQPRSRMARKSLDKLVKLGSAGSALLAIVFLFWILYEVALRGAHAINWDFFTKLTAPAGEVGGGVANAIVGTLLITAMATIIGVPIGVFAGVYLAEYGRQSRLAEATRFVCNCLMGTPSIIIGMFVYTVLVQPVGHFSGYAGAVALAILMLPVVARTTEDMLALVPNALRESALALGTPRWKTTISIVFRAAKSGLVTGALLAVARVSGETAPLLFTAMNSSFGVDTLSEPTANLTVTIFNYAMSPYEDWQQIAWGASLLITVAVLAVMLVTRVFFGAKRR